MASFGEGFTRGLFGGQNLRETRDKRLNEEASASMFNAAFGMQQAGDELAAEGDQLAMENEQRNGVMDMVGNASIGDITNAIVSNYAASGGKINEHTYKLATGVATTLFGIKEKETDYQQRNELHTQKKRLFEKQMQNYDSLISNRGRYSGGGLFGGKPTSFMKDYEYIKATQGEDAANAYLNHKSGVKGKEQKNPPTVKEVDGAVAILSTRLDNFDDLSQEEQWEAANSFASTGKMPKIVSEKGSGFFSSTKYRLAGSEPVAPKKEEKPKEEKKPKRAWEKYNY